MSGLCADTVDYQDVGSMEGEFIAADGALGETGASTDLKGFYLLSSEPAVAGGLWRLCHCLFFSFVIGPYLLLDD